MNFLIFSLGVGLRSESSLSDASVTSVTPGQGMDTWRVTLISSFVLGSLCLKLLSRQLHGMCALPQFTVWSEWRRSLGSSLGSDMWLGILLFRYVLAVVFLLLADLLLLASMWRKNAAPGKRPDIRIWGFYFFMLAGEREIFSKLSRSICILQQCSVCCQDPYSAYFSVVITIYNQHGRQCNIVAESLREL